MEKVILISSRWFTFDHDEIGIARNRKLHHQVIPICAKGKREFIPREIFKKEGVAGKVWEKYRSEVSDDSFNELINLITGKNRSDFLDSFNIENRIFSELGILDIDYENDDIELILEKLILLFTKGTEDKDFIMNIRRIKDTNIFIAFNWFDEMYRMVDNEGKKKLPYLNSLIATIKNILAEEGKTNLEFGFLLHDADLFKKADNYRLDKEDYIDILERIDENKIEATHIKKYFSAEKRNVYVYQHSGVTNGFFTNIIKEPDIDKIVNRKENYIIDILNSIFINQEQFNILLTDRYENKIRPIESYDIHYNLPLY